MEAGIKSKFTADEMVAHLVDAEWEERHTRRLVRLLKGARFRYQASMEQLDFSLPRNLDKNVILRFSDCRWIDKAQNIILTGPTGAGKSFIACALGHQACMQGYKVIYYNCSKLYAKLRLAQADGTYLKEVERIDRQKVLILDDFGLEALDGRTRLSLLELLEDRYGRASTVIASQIPVKQWHEIIGDATIADAVCDRVLHNAHRIELEGDSMRKIYAKNLTKSDSDIMSEKDKN
jgi:DNA replication protein DnaC